MARRQNTVPVWISENSPPKRWILPEQNRCALTMLDERGLFYLIIKCLRSADEDIWGESLKRQQRNEKEDFH